MGTVRYKAWWDASSYPNTSIGEGIGKVHSGGAVISAAGGRVSFMPYKKFPGGGEQSGQKPPVVEP